MSLGLLPSGAVSTPRAVTCHSPLQSSHGRCSRESCPEHPLPRDAHGCWEGSVMLVFAGEDANAFPLVWESP